MVDTFDSDGLADCDAVPVGDGVGGGVIVVDVVNESCLDSVVVLVALVVEVYDGLLL